RAATEILPPVQALADFTEGVSPRKEARPGLLLASRALGSVPPVFAPSETRSEDCRAVASAKAGAVAVAVHRLRARFTPLVREGVRPAAADDAEVEEEMRDLVATLSA